MKKLSLLLIIAVIFSSTLYALANHDTVTPTTVIIGSDVNAFDQDVADIGAISDQIGDIIIRGATTWQRLASGTLGYVLQSSSTSPFVMWVSTSSLGISAGSGLTSLNGQTGATQTFASSGPALSISSTGDVHTFSLATSTASITGVLTGTDWTTFNAKQATITVSTPILLSGVNLSFGGTYATSGASGIRIASSTGTWTWSQATSSASIGGFLSSADWTTFNAKITTSSLSSTATGLSYDNVTGIFSWTAGYEGLRTASSTNWNTAYDDRLKWDGGATGLVAATGRTSLGLVIGTNVQAWDNDLDDFAALAPTKGDLITTAGTDWVDLVVGSDGKVLTASSTATNGVSWETIVASAAPAGATTQVQYNNAGVTAGDSNFIWSSSTQLLSTPSSTITGFLKIPNGAGGTTVNTTGHVTVDSTSRTLNFYDGTAEVVLNPEKCDPFIVIEYPSSTVGHIDTTGDSFYIFNTTSTITKVKAWHTKTGNTANFNLTYNPDATSATSTFAVFATNQTVNTTTSTVLTSFASSTPNANDILRLSFSTASTSQMGVNICYRENP